MKLQQYVPIIVIVVILAVLAGAQGMFRTDSDSESPEYFQSQVGGVGNSIEDIEEFELEIELINDDEIEISYDGGRAVVRREERGEPEVTGDQAVEEIRTLVGSLPPLTTEEPLTLIQAVLDQLGIHQADVQEFELEYELVDGTEYKVELEVNDDDDDDDGRRANEEPQEASPEELERQEDGSDA